MLFTGAGGTALGLAALFNPLTAAVAPVVWLAGALLLATTAFSFTSIAYQALGAAWARAVLDVHSFDATAVHLTTGGSGGKQDPNATAGRLFSDFNCLELFATVPCGARCSAESAVAA
jgi:hypothetical protein